MSKIRVLLPLLLSTCLFPVGGFAEQQTVKTIANMRDVTDHIMAKVGVGDIEGGLAILQPYTVIPTSEFEAMEGQVKLQTPMLVQRFGPAVGSEFIKQTDVGQSLASLTYVNKFDHHVMRWVFYCYQTRSGWVIDTFRFDDAIQALFP